jgi:hypothetical protein
LPFEIFIGQALPLRHPAAAGHPFR